MIDPGIRDRWVEALRSKRYRQTKGRLRSLSPRKGLSYCCLGVLCDLIDNKGWQIIDGEWTHWFSGAATFVTPKGELPVSLGWATNAKLIRMNDSGYSFSAIADWIEKNL